MIKKRKKIDLRENCIFILYMCVCTFAQKEVGFFKTKIQNPGDRFVTVMQDFCTVASYSFAEVEESYSEMHQKVLI